MNYLQPIQWKYDKEKQIVMSEKIATACMREERVRELKVQSNQILDFTVFEFKSVLSVGQLMGAFLVYLFVCSWDIYKWVLQLFLQ